MKSLLSHAYESHPVHSGQLRRKRDRSEEEGEIGQEIGNRKKECKQVRRERE